MTTTRPRKTVNATKVLTRLAVGACAILALTATAAQAVQPYDHFHYDDSDSFTTENCGIEVSVQIRSTGVFTLWPVKDSDGQAYRGLNNYEDTEHVTNPATGQQLVIHANGVQNINSVRHVEGDIWEFDFVDAGTYTMYDADGTVLLRDRGLVKTRALIDTLGDGQPGGEFISDEPLLIAGPHSTDDAFCTAFLGALT
jgi:hypothetical protein